ncbi:dTDP-4-dehydrorhamnose reductase [Sulfurovum lithotrophicum]|uniref:dTDP-4-dehydrorhamnose reductase n=1 Tax=Sulfurovum lithotrophicum TaxID=206403 RepID=A0A7U4LZS5_9BACT|nr:dTDP-4-dehydrorhamnose reductase [Sulfurovum lithotrophicum]AKF24215.1 dTDP-4-dehydrorhamnose reductase [Sulfurovum lithotrophicum]
MPNILVTGSRGQLGSELRELVNNNAIFHFTDRSVLDITDQDAIKHFCLEKDIEVIINCAAYTAVDKAEEDEENADRINHLAVKYLAQIAKEREIRFVHISTDYVFDGTNFMPYVESNRTNPTSVYGRTKLAGEEAIRKINPDNTVIIRTSWVYSTYGSNFVKTMLRLGKERDTLGVIFDQVGTPTYARDLAQAILDIVPQIENKEVEIYHYSNEGVLSWYDFAKEIMKMAKLECKINPIETKSYPTPAKRPYYSLLNKAKIKETFNLEIPYWKDGLDTCLRTMGERK